MRLLFRRLVLMTGRQLRHLIGAAIHRPTRSPENVDGQDGRNHAALLAVSPSQFSHDRVSQSTAIAIFTLRANATWFETGRVRWGCVPSGPQLATSAGAIGPTYAANGRSKQVSRGTLSAEVGITSRVLQKGRFLMRPVVFVSVIFATCALLASPASAQSDQDRWMLNAQIGPAFGTFGTTPNFDAKGGYRFNDNISVIGEFGGLSQAPFEKASAVAPAVNAPDTFTASKVHVNGYHYNANLMVAPANWHRVTPYVTGGFGAFTGSTVARYNVGPTWQRRYDSATNFATNVGGGLTYRVNRWLGVNADYRHFIVNADAIEHVNRFTTGISLFVR